VLAFGLEENIGDAHPLGRFELNRVPGDRGSHGLDVAVLDPGIGTTELKRRAGREQQRNDCGQKQPLNDRGGGARNEAGLRPGLVRDHCFLRVALATS
jgi:hypothetical protein